MKLDESQCLRGNECKLLDKSLLSGFKNIYKYICIKFLNIDILVNYGFNIQN